MVPAFEIVGSTARKQWLQSADPYAVAMSYLRGEFDVEGDLVDAVRHYWGHRAGWKERCLTLADWVMSRSWWKALETRAHAARNIRFHYDRSNEFYRLFLDEQMVYSCAYFRSPEMDLAQAQLAKLDHVFRKLNLQSTERLLDIGCGWGALVMRAAKRYGVLATGCTLSHEQAYLASDQVLANRLDGIVRIVEKDYRDINGSFDKIVSIGMSEHLGVGRLAEYFHQVFGLLQPGGMFLNHCITKPAGTAPAAHGVFIGRDVFPGGQVTGLADIIHHAEHAGFTVLDVESLGPHYALTCREWVSRLVTNRAECLKIVDARTWRTWSLYLAGSAALFESGQLGLHQTLFMRRCDVDARFSTHGRSRDHIYGPE